MSIIKSLSYLRGIFMIQMVPRGGIEPTTLSLEGFCSSTELPGHISDREERIVRNSRKSNRFLYLFFFRTSLFYDSSSTLCCRYSIEIVDLIYVDDLPPLLRHEVSYDRSYEGDEHICFD